MQQMMMMMIMTMMMMIVNDAIPFLCIHSIIHSFHVPCSMYKILHGGKTDQTHPIP